MPNKKHNPSGNKKQDDGSDVEDSYQDGRRDGTGEFSEDRGHGKTKSRDSNVLSAPDRWENPWDKEKESDSKEE